MQIIKERNHYQVFQNENLFMEFLADKEISAVRLNEKIDSMAKIQLVVNVLIELNMSLDSKTQDMLAVIKLEEEAKYILQNYYECVLIELNGQTYWVGKTKVVKKQEYSEYSSQLLRLLSYKAKLDCESVDLLVKNAGNKLAKVDLLGWAAGSGHKETLSYILSKYQFGEEDFFHVLGYCMYRGQFAMFEQVLNKAPRSKFMDLILKELSSSGKYKDLINLKISNIN